MSDMPEIKLEIFLRCTWYKPEKFLRYTRAKPKIYPIFITEIGLWYAKDMPGRYKWNLPEKFLKYKCKIYLNFLHFDYISEPKYYNSDRTPEIWKWDTPEIYVRYTWYIPMTEIFPRFLGGIHVISKRYTRDLSDMYPRYKRDMPDKYLTYYIY